MGDVTPMPGRGLHVLVGHAKTGQQGRGQPVAVWANPTDPGVCPAATLDAWLTHRRSAPDLIGAPSDADRRSAAAAAGLGPAQYSAARCALAWPS